MNASDPFAFDIDSLEATITLGTAIGRSITGGLVVALVGPLGAGKTQLVKGIAIGNGLDDARNVTSPTFDLVHEYPGRLTLYHIDVYRLQGPGELSALGFDEMIRPDTAVVIEWADRAAALIPTDALWINADVTGEQTRSFTFNAGGPTAEQCIECLKGITG